MCKVGGVDKEYIGVKPHEKVKIGKPETMCNPIAQAEILNEAETDFNILMGLCVGHDSLFIKYAKVLTTIFAVKDRVLGHNPMAAIYNYGSYYERFQQDRLKEFTVKKDWACYRFGTWFYVEEILMCEMNANKMSLARRH